MCTDRKNESCFILQWDSGRFKNPQLLPLTGRASQVDMVHTRTDGALLLFVFKGILSALILNSIHSLLVPVFS